ncbi:MAG TPA: OmpA family protein [Steroidobacteraceae bacterium]|jgi:outer membrane protein OmpA-like peptidoglycan-associated protein
MKTFTLIGATALLLAACATAPQRNEQVDQARAEIDTLSQDPLAQQAAAHDLDAARASLQEAQGALQNRQPTPVVDHLAYLARRHAEAGEARVAEAHARQDVARSQDERSKILLANRERETQNAQAQAQNAQAEAESAKSQALAAQTQLASAQQQLADLQAKKTDRGLVVTLGDVLFDTGQATLKPGAGRALDRLAGYMKSNPQTRILIEGHTDSRGSDDYNQALSQRRAQAVATELESRGVAEDQYRIRGLGKSYPVASNDTAAGRQQNRRVEIVFSDASGRFAQGATDSVQR